MEIYPWVSEGSVRKFHRAVAELRKKGQAVTEDAVKALYLRDGGLVIGDPSTVRGNGEEEPVEAVPVEAEAPKEKKEKKEKKEE